MFAHNVYETFKSFVNVFRESTVLPFSHSARNARTGSAIAARTL